MSPRRPAALRGSGGQDLREHLIAAAARLIGERGSAGLGVRDIARAAQVADGVLYNYFEDKEDLLAHALLAHVAAVMGGAPPMPAPGSGTVEGNLRAFIDNGLTVLGQVMPAFAGLMSQPKVLSRFRAMVGGDAGFGSASKAEGEPGPGAEGGDEPWGGAVIRAAERLSGAAGPAPHGPGAPGPAGLPAMLGAYLREEQRLGRVDADADVDAVARLVIGAIHGEILPAAMFHPPSARLTTPPDFAARLAKTILAGIAPRSER